MFKKPLWQTVWTHIRLGAVCSGSTLFASILNSSAILGNYLQQTTSADDIFRCIFFWRFKAYTVLQTCFVPWGCLRFVIVVFHDHTHLLFLKSALFVIIQLIAFLAGVDFVVC